MIKETKTLKENFKFCWSRSKISLAQGSWLILSKFTYFCFREISFLCVSEFESTGAAATGTSGGRLVELLEKFINMQTGIMSG